MGNDAVSTDSSLTLERLIRLHNLTKDVTDYYERNLRAILEITGPLFRPRRILAEYMEGQGTETVLGADQNMAELRELFAKAAGSPLDLRKELPQRLDAVSTQIQVYPWEYSHELGNGVIQITAPLTWVITFPSTYSLSMFRQVIAGRQERDPVSLHAFALNACLMHEVMRKQRNLATLLETCRYRIEVRKSPLFGELGLVTLSAPFTTLRPPDELLKLAAGVSGGNAFQEVLDLAAARQVRDPVRERLSQILLKFGEEP